MVLTAAGCAVGCNVVVQSGGMTWQLVSSGLCYSMEGQRHDHLEVLAEVWAAGAPQTVHQCAHWWAHSQAVLKRVGCAFPHMPFHWSQICRYRAEAEGTSLHSDTEVCNWLKCKNQKEQREKQGLMFLQIHAHFHSFIYVFYIVSTIN